MSMKELNFYNHMLDKALLITIKEDKVKLAIKFGIDGEEEFKLDRNQANLLYLYLKERFEPK